MEIDNKIIKKLIETLEQLKKSLNDKEILNVKSITEEETDDPNKIIKSPICRNCISCTRTWCKEIC